MIIFIWKESAQKGGKEQQTRNWKQISYLTILFALRQMKFSAPLKPMMSSFLFVTLILNTVTYNGWNPQILSRLIDDMEEVSLKIDKQEQLRIDTISLDALYL